MQDLFNEWKTATNEVKNAGWYQQFELENDLKITFVPTRHWSRRGLFDTNERLWGGYVIEGAGKKIYHGGDSGYGSHYKELAETFGTIDYFFIGIGAYRAALVYEGESQQSARRISGVSGRKAKILIPMHYGTFDLSDEPPNQPLKLLKQAAENAGQIDKLKPLQINESLEF